MKLTIIPSDNTILVDGDARKPDGATYPEGVRAIQWDGSSGYMEFHGKPQEYFEDPDVIAPFLALHAAAKARDDVVPVKTFAELKAAEIEYWSAERERMIARMLSIQDQLNSIGDTAGANSCRALRQSLLGLFTDPAVAGATDMPTLKAAFKARYKVATDLATTSAKLEYAKYNQ